MRLRKIRRVVDAMMTQRRTIVHLECGHNISITEADLDKTPLLLVHSVERGEFVCPECPDAPASPATAKEEFDGLFTGKRE